MKTIFICAGELSGDRLAAGLITALKAQYPHLEFIGIAGPQMQEAGCKSLFPIETLSVMGIFEILPKLPKILKLRRQLIKQLLTHPPDLYIGVDSPDFNLPIEAKLKSKGIKTIHYVSPTVWAWRKGRVAQIKKSADLLLCVFPFEEEFLIAQGLNARFVGHRSADYLPNLLTQKKAREALHFADEKIVTILPGSRGGEIQKMMPIFLQTALWCWQKDPELKFIIAAANPIIAKQIDIFIQKTSQPFSITVVVDKTYAAIKAADVVLATSGTVTLETFLLDKPMVVAYKMNFLTWGLVKALVKVKFCSLPNLLAKKAIVPEFLQTKATPQNLGLALMHWLEHPEAVSALRTEYQTLLGQLQCNADKKAAEAVLALLTS